MFHLHYLLFDIELQHLYIECFLVLASSLGPDQGLEHHHILWS